MRHRNPRGQIRQLGGGAKFKFGQLILSKIIKIASPDVIINFKAKMHQIRFRPGYGVLLLRKGEGKGRKGEGEGEGAREEEREGRVGEGCFWGNGGIAESPCSGANCSYNVSPQQVIGVSLT